MYGISYIFAPEMYISKLEIYIFNLKMYISRLEIKLKE